MLRALKTVLIAGCVLAGFANSGFAADQDLPIFIEDAPELQSVEIGNGWYIRGDIGVNFAGKHDTKEYSPGGGTGVRYLEDFGDAINVGVGIGYQVNDYFRVDAGYEHLFESNFSSTQLVAPRGPCLGYGEVINGAGQTVIQDPYDIDNCLDVDSASYSANNLMANAYIDLGTYIGFTPYVGAGIGIARVSWKEETDATTCIPTDPAAHFEGCNAFGTINQPAPNTPYTEKGITNDGVDYRMSYALMAGVAYNVSQNVKLDLSYRMLNVGGNDINYGVNPGSDMAKDGFGTQQVRLGVRYSLW